MATIVNNFRTGYRLQIVWEIVSQDVVKNTSKVQASVQLVSTGSSYSINSSAQKSVSLTINGTKYSGTCYVGLDGNETKTLFTVTTDVSHDADGKKSCSFSCSLGINVTLSGVYWGTISASGSGTLTTIARASQPSLSASSVDMGKPVTINTNRASTGFTHTITYSFLGASGTIGTSVGSSIIWNIPLDLAGQIPSATSGSITITCDTYSGGTKIGTKTVTLTGNVPSSVVPSITSITCLDAVTDVSINVGKYVQGLSKLDATINGAVTSYSSIKSYKITFEGVSYASSRATTGLIKGSGTLTVIGTVTDNRGRTGTKSITVSVLPYVPPKITSFDVVRCNSNGTANSLGTSAKVTFAGSVQSLLNGTTEKNSLTYKILSKDRDITTWTTKKTLTVVNITVSTNEVLSTYVIENSFDFRLEITDKFNTTMSLDIVGTGQVTMSWARIGLGIGKVWEQGALDVGGDIYESGVKLRDKFILKTGDDVAGVLKFANNTGIQGKNTTGTAYNIGYIDSGNKASIGTQSLPLQLNASANPNFNIAGILREAWHDGNNAVSLGNNGYQKLASGLIIQWGMNNFAAAVFTGLKSEIVTFPIAYPTLVRVVTASGYSSVPDRTAIGCRDYTQTGFTMTGYRSDTSNFYIYWMAIGY